MQSDMNLSPLVLPCSRILLMHAGIYYKPYNGRALGFLFT